MAIVWLLGIGCPPKQNKQCSRPTQQPSCLKSGGNRLVLVPGTGKRSCLPPLLQVHLVGLESTALQKRLAHAAAYWVVGWKRCVFFCFFLRRQTQPHAYTFNELQLAQRPLDIKAHTSKSAYNTTTYTRTSTTPAAIMRITIN